MKSPVDFYTVTNENGDTLLFEKGTLEAAGMSSAEKLQEVFGEEGRWRRLWLKAANGERQREIAQLCQQPDPMVGFRYDASLEAPATAVAFISQWQGFDDDPELIGEPTVETYLPQPEVVTNFIQAVIAQHRNPNPLAHAGFRQALTDWQESKSRSSVSASPKKR